MNTNFPPDLKKLITAFLAIAIVVSSGALALSSFTITKSSPVSAEGTVNESASGKIAFVEPLPETPDQGSKEPALPLPMIPSSNITDNLAQTIARQLIAQNPEGPVLPNGTRGLLIPDGENLDALIDENIKTTALPDAEEEIESKRLIVLSSFGAPEVDQYIIKTSSALQETTGSQEFKNLVGQEPSLEAVRAGEITYARAIERLYRVPIPAPLLAFHRGLLEYLIRQQDVLSVIADYKQDPLKALAFMSVDEETGAILGEFENELEKIRFVAPTSRAPSAPTPFARALFGINTASAQSLDEGDLKDVLEKVMDQINESDQGSEDDSSVDSSNTSQTVPTTLAATTDQKTLNFQSKETKATTSNWKQRLYQWARQLGTAILKNVIVHKVVEQIVGWVQGGAKPQFVTDWKSFLSDSFNEAAGTTLQNIYPDLCYSFSPTVRSYLQASVSGGTSQSSPVSCTLDQIVGNIKDFHDDFTKGGWVAFGATARPSNNIFGATFLAQGIIAEEGERAREAADAQGRSSGGFLPTQRCAREVPEQSQMLRRSDGSGSYVYKTPAYCAEWEYTTPGTTVSDITSKALGSSLDEVINADDLESLISAVVDAFLNKMITSEEKGLLGTSRKNKGGSQTPNTPIICEGLSGKALRQCLNSLEIDQPPPSVPIPPPSTSTSTPTSTPPTPAGCLNTAPVGDRPCSNLSNNTTPTLKECRDSCGL